MYYVLPHRPEISRACVCRMIMSSLALLIFISPLSTTATTPCGDLIFLDDEGEEYRVPIEDCADPFSLADPNFTLTITPEHLISGVILEENDIVTTSLPASVWLDAESVAPYDLSEHSLFLHEGQDYREVAKGLTYELPVTVPGNYTVVTTVISSVGPGMTKGEGTIITWLASLRQAVLPTAYAQIFELYSGRATRTFTVEAEAAEGASSVLFLPGIQASRLYTDGLLGTEDQLWEPNINSDVAELAMDESGVSVNDVYTRDIIDEALGVVGVYDSFIDFMDGLENDRVINEWEPFAYDWRYAVQDVVLSGSRYEDGVRSLVDTVEALADNSFTGKVTIIAHSNGGLLAKALLIEYPELAEYVDTIVFIGTPQLGTPTAIAAILHGYDQAKLGGVLVSAMTAREATRNMPGAYGLLPGQAYFEKQEDLVMSFDTSSSTALFRNEYGNAINTEIELRALLVGQEGRGEAQMIEEALLANESMVDKSLEYHREELDVWTALQDVEVYEVVGVGLDTESGFEYREFTERVCEYSGPFGSQVCTTKNFYKPVPWISQYGDETVMGVSAEGYMGEKETFFVDLFEANIRHANITEMPTIQNLLSNLLLDKVDLSDNSLVSTSTPELARKRSILATHSPVSLSVIDEEGNIVGKATDGLKEDIPGSSYRQLAGSSYVIVPEGISYDVLIAGLADGGMTLTIETLDGEEQSTTAVVPIEVISSTTEIRFSATGAGTKESFTNLQVDENGDGAIDHEVTLDGEVIPSPPLEVTYDDLRESIKVLTLRKWEISDLLRQSMVAERYSQGSRKWADRIEDNLLNKINETLLWYVKEGKITAAEHEAVTVIIKKLKVN
jgi:pimeloyl-ACP methyl ester carboxylesterase